MNAAEMSKGIVEILRNGVLRKNSAHKWKIRNLMEIIRIKALLIKIKNRMMVSIFSLKKGLLKIPPLGFEANSKSSNVSSHITVLLRIDYKLKFFLINQVQILKERMLHLISERNVIK